MIYNRHGCAVWNGDIDLSTLSLPLSETILIDDCSIEVYINEKNKPALGK